jgi:hypothetical protein
MISKFLLSILTVAFLKFVRPFQFNCLDKLEDARYCMVISLLGILVNFIAYKIASLLSVMLGMTIIK